MKIKTRFYLAISTLPLLLLLLVGSGWLQISHLNKESKNIQANYEMSILAGQIRADFKDQSISLRNVIMYEEEEIVRSEIALLEREAEAVRENIAQLESSVVTPEQKERVDTLKQLNEEFETYKNKVITLVDQNKHTEAKAFMNANSLEIRNKMTETLADISNKFNDNLATSLQSMTATALKDITLFSAILGITLLIVITVLLKSIFTIFKRVTSMSEIMSDIANGDTENLEKNVEVIGDDEDLDKMAESFNQMTDSLKNQLDQEKELSWKKSHITDITTSLTGDQDIKTLGQTLLSKVVPLAESSQAVFYVKDLDDPSNQTYNLVSAYALKERNQVKRIQPGEGLVGQAIVEKSPIILTDVPADYISVSSGLGEATPFTLYVLPIVFKGEVNAVLEIASFKSYTELQRSFLEELTDSLGIVLESVMGRIQLAKLLEETQTLMEEIQAQSEELQNQQEELKATNEELEEQTQALRESETKLQLQQEELEQTNAELEEKAKKLEEQNVKYEQTNREVEEARAELERKAEQLALSSKYKSEFLANMSHELRTPLNSLLILSKLLADNPSANLTEKQVEYSKTIYSSGTDLLVLINDILDLAKIESGKTEVIANNISIQSLAQFIESSFKPLADNKQLEFNVLVQKDVPDSIFSDEVRIHQVLKNLLSNALKFTEKGSVTLEISTRQESADKMLAFSVIDTGIGVSNDKLNLIFEAFQQADGTTSRKFGGTGLGLSISREIATLLGGEITVESEEGKGSKFTFLIGDYEMSSAQLSESDVAQQEVASTFAELSVEQIKTMQEREQEPIRLPESENNYIKRLLIVDDDLNQRNSLMELIGDMDFVIKAVSSGKEAIDLLKVNPFDCMILDLGLTDTNGFDVLEEIKKHEGTNGVKVFIYTGRDLTSKEEMQLNKYAHTIIIKNEFSPTRLKEELELYLNELHHQEEDLAETDLKLIPSNMVLKGKKILLVDDDIRNVFALSTVLEMAGMEVIFAENGYESLDALESNKDIDLVLMDIMMPEMDGYEAIQRIRQQSQYADLPIIALTAKAMKEDREKCLAIGASDYIAKPVDTDKLISLIKVWLY